MNKYNEYSEALDSSFQAFKKGQKGRAVGFWLWYILTPISLFVLIIGGVIDFWPHNNQTPLVTTSTIPIATATRDNVDQLFGGTYNPLYPIPITAPMPTSTTPPQPCKTLGYAGVSLHSPGETVQGNIITNPCGPGVEAASGSSSSLIIGNQISQ